MSNKPPSHLTKAQAARFLGVSPTKVTNLVQAWALPVETILDLEMIPTKALVKYQERVEKEQVEKERQK